MLEMHAPRPPLTYRIRPCRGWEQQLVLLKPCPWLRGPLKSQNHSTRVGSKLIGTLDSEPSQDYPDPPRFQGFFSHKPINRHTWILAVAEIYSAVCGVCAFVCCVWVSPHQPPKSSQLLRSILNVSMISDEINALFS